MHYFLNNLIDYAGLFPPAKLPLSSAITNYVQYKKSEDAWMMGPFVISISQLGALHPYMDKFTKDFPLVISATGTRSGSLQEFEGQLKEDFQKMDSFSGRYTDIAKVGFLEVPLPNSVPNKKELDIISKESSKRNLVTFCEVNTLMEDWKPHVVATLEAIASYNKKTGSKLGIKLRMGGIKAEMFPDFSRIATIISKCRDLNLSLKFTAGLHHPIRMYREEVKGYMHGFLNVFIGGMLAHVYGFKEEKIEEILGDESPFNFRFSESFIMWKDYKIDNDEIQKLRETYFLSYGSCSFDEPREELKEITNTVGVLS